MPNLDDGIARFITGECTIKVHFPVSYRGEEGIACKYCPYLSSSMRMCNLNREVVHYAEKYVGAKCPLQIILESE